MSENDGCFGLHLARKGERVYVSIQRERSGVSSGELDFNVASEQVAQLTDAEFAELLDVIAAAQRSVISCRILGVKPAPKADSALNDDGKAITKRLAYQFWAESQAGGDKEHTLRHIEATLEAVVCDAGNFTKKEPKP